VSKGKHAQNPAKRFFRHGEAYFLFITTPGIEPTNNLAEQAIRFVVIDRRITQRTRSETGRRWCERIWTTIAACTQQGRSVFEFLTGVGRIPSSRRSTTLATAVRHMTALSQRLPLTPLRSPALAVCQAVNGYLEWDAANLTFPNCPQANHYVKRDYREGWTCPNTVGI
jgi:hypothetical protein